MVLYYHEDFANKFSNPLTKDAKLGAKLLLTEEVRKSSWLPPLVDE